MYPPRSRRQRQSKKPFNLDVCVSTEIERHPGANWAFPTAHPSPTTYNDKSRGKAHSASRAPIPQKAPSTGATMHDRERRSHKAPNTDHKDRGISVQHSRGGNLGHPHSCGNFVFVLDNRGKDL
ncbi:hypothetical protein CDL15_Pgr016505 [Punica granatum]|uniref:Uncharacterized protein n=1 Tax=Punica granatum TaxID=22663 RepID=A0A218WJG3_PUNGR|nr:hypothetical protein CDL15_Pgr016505 [Punica granatum]